MKYFLIILLLFSFSIHANTIHVGKNHPIKSVKQGIALAKDGDTLMVHGGIYKEGNIIIDKKIVFIGKGLPVLDGEKKHEVLSIKADSVVVDGFKVIRSAYATITDPCGIKVYNKQYVVIQNNVLDDNFFGIYLQNSKNCTIKNNYLKAYGKEEQQLGNGIHCWKSNDILIIGNRIDGHRDGIYFEFVYDSLVWRNISINNIRYGLHFMFSHSDTYITNIFRNNGAGVAVMYSKDVKMFNNHFEENWGDSAYGLLLKDISDSYIFNNTFARNTSAIYMEGASRNRIEKNVFLSNGWGLKIQASCLDNEIVNNNFLKNTFDISTNGSLVLNTFNSNYWDKYEGYDLNKDGIGDVPYHPLSLFAVLTESTPSAMLLYRSFMITLLDKSEKILPSITPDNFIDKTPLMKSLPL
ncbi:nitrous oxide reductase family maturation protein NosD [Flavobacterium sp.]|uniref:nitrous oxide reductase family maturation protein NosD n=1 Tax=Flavobacterium sp. TaxID=239 RepID=UPI00262562BD|nr:nitrous oxide reductase family maturation protein NosD [Flavobacterium sp.]MDD2985305.1 nitrous oxide reductase family maturation protein NosD [Flavobacterium sp.]